MFFDIKKGEIMRNKIERLSIAANTFWMTRIPSFVQDANKQRTGHWSKMSKEISNLLKRRLTNEELTVLSISRKHGFGMKPFLTDEEAQKIINFIWLNREEKWIGWDELICELESFLPNA